MGSTPCNENRELIARIRELSSLFQAGNRELSLVRFQPY
jgi:hypothetical protein